MNERCHVISRNFLHFVLLLSVLSVSSGCTYAKRRALDLTDIVDVRYGISYGLAGVKAEITDYSAAGLGVGYSKTGQEWYGRRVAGVLNECFFHFVTFGFEDSTTTEGYHNATSVSAMFLQYREYRPPLIDRFRVGAEVLLPVIHLGLYLNTGEVYDFLAGLANADPAGDDDISKGESIDLREFNEGDPNDPQTIARDKAEKEWAMKEAQRLAEQYEMEEKAKQEREKRKNPTP